MTLAIPSAPEGHEAEQQKVLERLAAEEERIAISRTLREQAGTLMQAHDATLFKLAQWMDTVADMLEGAEREQILPFPDVDNRQVRAVS